MKGTFYVLLFTIVLFTSCAPQIYYAKDFYQIARKHRIVAILPADISLKLRPNQAKKLTPEQLKDEEARTGYDIQNAMYTWFLKRSYQLNYTIKFQDITKTNSLLKEANIQLSDIKTKDRAALAEILGVDALIQNSTILEKPMSEGASIALGVLVGFWGTTNQVSTSINIHNSESGDLLWKYDYRASGSVGTSASQLVNNLMRNASRKFPYKSEIK